MGEGTLLPPGANEPIPTLVFGNHMGLDRNASPYTLPLEYTDDLLNVIGDPTRVRKRPGVSQLLRSEGAGSTAMTIGFLRMGGVSEYGLAASVYAKDSLLILVNRQGVNHRYPQIVQLTLETGSNIWSLSCTDHVDAHSGCIVPFGGNRFMVGGSYYFTRPLSFPGLISLKVKTDGYWGHELLPSGDAYNKAAYSLAWHNNRLFMGAMKPGVTATFNVDYSDTQGEPAAAFPVFPNTPFAVKNEGHGERMISLKAGNEVLYAMCSRSIYGITGKGPGEFRSERIANDTGGGCAEGFADVPGGIVGFAVSPAVSRGEALGAVRINNVIALAGFKLAFIGDKLSGEFKDLTVSLNPYSQRSIYIPSKGWAVMIPQTPSHVCETSLHPSFKRATPAYVLETKSGSWWKWIFDENVSPGAMISAPMIKSLDATQREVMYLGGQGAGLYFLDDQNPMDNGVPFDSHATTCWFGYGANEFSIDHVYVRGYQKSGGGAKLHIRYVKADGFDTGWVFIKEFALLPSAGYKINMTGYHYTAVMAKIKITFPDDGVESEYYEIAVARKKFNRP